MKCNKPFVKNINGIDKVIPCGKCINCRKIRTNDWANRLLDHLSIFNNSCFITITYSDKNNPDNLIKLYSLSKYELQLFIKRVRKHFINYKLSYYAVGEYGDLNERPHYHLILFGIPLGEFKLYRVGSSNSSEVIDKLWKHGFNNVGYCEEDSLRYVTGYALKKMWGYQGKFAYDDIGREPPFSLCSKNIGMEYLIRNYMKVKQDYWDGKPISRYYIKLLNNIGANRGTLINEYKEEINLIKSGKAKNARDAKIMILDRNDQAEIDHIAKTKLFAKEAKI